MALLTTFNGVDCFICKRNPVAGSPTPFCVDCIGTFHSVGDPSGFLRWKYEEFILKAKPQVKVEVDAPKWVVTMTPWYSRSSS
jgi:hypothetical protein